VVATGLFRFLAVWPSRSSCRQTDIDLTVSVAVGGPELGLVACDP